MNGVPEVDGLIMSVATDLARSQAVGVSARRAVSNQGRSRPPNKTNLSDYAQDMPEDKFKKETLELINAMYPNKEPKPGPALQDRRVVRVARAQIRAAVALIPVRDRVRLAQFHRR